MADDEKKKEEEGAEDSKDAGKKKGGSKLVLIIALVIGLGGAGAGAYFGLVKGAQADESQPDSKKKKKRGKKTAVSPDDIGHELPLETFIVNLDEPGGTRYLKVGLSLELAQPPTETEKKLTIRLRDKIIVFLSGLRVNQIRKREAKIEMKQRLQKAADEVFGEDVVQAVYFRTFVMQ